ncbi:siderophore-interacting protein [Leucobacter allii]|uniref:Siderophore-interacting protein n=1 Tax=Leucobacter allii TaxID=2932247 RepID=A0ABY4FIT7_9MICO|nr:siderophore-interacting protein [Leucobacter allii]UOQ55832.1 siderophore-interacting protein [Leucobacter allii]
MARRPLETHPLVLRRLDVLRVTEVTPRMRRVTLGGPELAPFARDGLRQPGFRAPGFDDHVKAIFAGPDELEDVLPIQLAHGIEWVEAPARIARDYTPRRVDPAAREIDLDFVLHGDGPAASWAAGAVPGDALWIVGPKSSLVLPERLDWIVLIGDETALPAIGRYLDERPTEARVRAVVLIEHPSARQELPLRVGDTLDWVVARPGDREALLAAARAALPPGDASAGFVWAAAESRALLPLRRFLGRERGIDKTRTSLTGYWHADAAADAAFPPVPSPAAWFAVRAALVSGLLDAVADQPGADREALARGRGLPPAALAALLPTLAHHGLVLEDRGGGWRIGPAGEALLADPHAREGYDGPEGETMHALGELAAGLRDGAPARAIVRGATLAAELGRDAERFAEHCADAEVLRFVLGGLIADPVWEEVASARFAGPGAAVLLDLLREAGWRGAAAASGTPAQRSVLLAAPEFRAETASDGAAECVDADDAVDAEAIALELGACTDREAAERFEALRGRARRAIVVDRARPDALDPRAHEAQLLALAATGAGLRDARSLERLAAPVGWRLERVVGLGWGFEAVILADAPLAPIAENK